MNRSHILGGLLGAALLAGVAAPTQTNLPAAGPGGKVYIIPIQEAIMPPLVYVVRRGVKEAMEAKADAIILDMNTDGGRLDVTKEIFQILGKFEGRTVTYVNDRAFSAGAFISVATQEIYMAPQSVIGAAAPVLMGIDGSVQEMPKTVQAKMNSAVRALIRTQAEKNGHNIDVIEAMIDERKAFEIDGEVLNKEGDILTLTDRQAAKAYGNPPKPLLSSGTVETLDHLLVLLGYANAERVDIKPSGAEKLGTWIMKIRPLLLIIGLLGLYIEFKTPGFGLPGIVGIVAFSIFFLGGYVAGYSGSIWAIVFVVGILLVALELFVFPGTYIAGGTGVILMLVALVMGMVDTYPGTPSMPRLPDLQVPMRDLAVAIAVSFVMALVLARFFPKTTLFHQMVSESASGVASVAAFEAEQTARAGKIGVTVSLLNPGGKARFDDQLLDVITRGERVEKGRPVKIISHSGLDAVVEETTD